MRRTVSTAILVLALGGALIPGCATRDAGKQAYFKDGVQYGTTGDRAFRGRWWNYYERGRSFLDGGFLAEAERDFRTALKQRTSDQRWARIYGLRFIPEYFPNRELGIALFHQGQLPEAETYLLRSVEGGTVTARAGYYLNEARAAIIASNASDAAAPSIAVDPSANAVFGNLEVTLAGTVRDDWYIREITVKGVPIQIAYAQPEVAFSQAVVLGPGENTVPVVATDLSGKITTLDVPVRVDVDGPAISFDGPVTLPGTITGVAYDPAGVTALTINDQAVTYSDRGDGSVAFELAIDKADPGTPVVYTCTDAFNNRTAGAVPVDTYRVAEWPEGIVLAAALKMVPLSAEWEAETVEGRPVAIHRVLVAQAQGEPVVTITDFEAGQVVYENEIVVTLEIESPVAPQTLLLNDSPMDNLIPGRPNQKVSRKVRLGEEEGPRTLMAKLDTTDGRTASASIELQRKLNEIERIEDKLALAAPGSVWDGAPKILDEVNYVNGRLESVFTERKRFNLQDRKSLGLVLQENEITNLLGKEEDRRALAERIQLVDFFLLGELHRDADNVLDLTVTIVNRETSLIDSVVDVAAPVTTKEQLDSLVDQLVSKIEQAFPRVQGFVKELRGSNELVAEEFGEVHRLRPGMKCVVFVPGAETVSKRTGKVSRDPVRIVGTGAITQIAPETASVQYILKDGEVSTGLDTDGFVITK